MVSLIKMGAKTNGVLYDEWHYADDYNLRLARGLDVVHVLEHLKHTQMTAVLDEIRIASDGQILSGATQDALGKDFLAAFCSSAGARRSGAFIIPDVQGFIGDVLSFDEAEETYSINAQAFLEACASHIKDTLSPKDLQQTKTSLLAARDASFGEREFPHMRQGMSIKLQDEIPATYGLMSCFKSVVNDGKITAKALEVLRVGFDFDNLEERLAL